MARVTVEDCIVKIPNRFELVMSAAQRTRDISAGAELTVERDNDKNPVISLREIADETVSLENLKESLIRNAQRTAPSREEQGEDNVDEDQVSVSNADTAETLKSDALNDVLTIQDDSAALDAAGSLAFQDEVDIDDED